MSDQPSDTMELLRQGRSLSVAETDAVILELLTEILRNRARLDLFERVLRTHVSPQVFDLIARTVPA